MRVCAALTAGFGLRSLRALPFVAVASCLLIGASGLHRAKAVGDTRTIKLHHVHTDEDLTITYKKNGKYDDEALKKINWIMRDWRKNQAITMDPHEIDLLWEVYQEVGATEAIAIVCGYRSPETNSMLRRRSKGVARFSQHTLGKAIDFYIPGVPLDHLRATAMKLQGGGVGYYPTSGSPFVHLDVGNVRAWPRMTREQLVKLFPNGRTAHVPADGTPLPGYQLALNDLERRHGSTAPASEQQQQQPKRKSLLAALFGVDKDAEEADDTAQVQDTPAPAPRSVATAKPAPAAPAPPRVQVAAANPVTPVPLPLPAPARARIQVANADDNMTIRPLPVMEPLSAAVPLPPRRPVFQIAAAAKPVTVASLGSNDIINSRGLWDNVTPPARTAETNGLDVSAARRKLAASMAAPAPSRETTAAIGPFGARDAAPQNHIALAFADIDAVPRLAAVSAKPERSATVTTKGQTSIANKPIDTANSRPSAERLADPWMRGLMLTRSVQNSLVVTRIGEPDYANLTAFMRKPGSAVVMSFSNDPNPGLSTDQFTGSAVVFPPTIAFGAPRRTASLQ